MSDQQQPNVISLGANDKDRAAKVRAELMPHLQAAGDVMATAAREGLKVGFNINLDAFSRPNVTIDVVKLL